ncbi:MAG: glycosyltransferase family A protein [Candidatus Magasanikbacteria bacterium]
MIEEEQNKIPKISIIIPVYNHAGALRQALDSLRKQSFKDFEVIVIDDGSQDGLDYVIHDFDECLTLRLFRQQNKGAPSARNKGFEQSSGEFVIFWDADIVGEPEMLEKMLKKLEENVHADFVFSNFYLGKKLMKAKPFDYEILKKVNYIHSTALLRRESVIRWDEALRRFQDWDYWLSLAEQGKNGIWIDEELMTIIAEGTMSHWLPKFAYTKPWKYLPFFKEKVSKYERAKEIIYRKHGIHEEK